MNYIEDTTHIKTLTCTSFTPPAGCINNAAVVAGAGISASKLQHRFQCIYSQNTNVDAAAERKVIHAVRGATATINTIYFGSRVACTGDSTITCNLYKNGSSILTAAVVLDNANTAYILEAGTLSSASLVQGDILEIGITVSAGTGALGDGVFGVCQLDEDAN